MKETSLQESLKAHKLDRFLEIAVGNPSNPTPFFIPKGATLKAISFEEDRGIVELFIKNANVKDNKGWMIRKLMWSFDKDYKLRKDYPQEWRIKVNPNLKKIHPSFMDLTLRLEFESQNAVGFLKDYQASTENNKHPKEEHIHDS